MRNSVTVFQMTSLSNIIFFVVNIIFDIFDGIFNNMPLHMSLNGEIAVYNLALARGTAI